MTKKKWEIVAEHLPGTVEQLAASTGMTKMAVKCQISFLVDRGIAKGAYRVFCPKIGRRQPMLYGLVGAMPTEPEQPPKPDSINPPKPKKVHVINSPYRTAWVGGSYPAQEGAAA